MDPAHTVSCVYLNKYNWTIRNCSYEVPCLVLMTPMYLEGLDGLLVCESLKSLSIHLQNFITWKGECNQYTDTQTDVYSCMQRFWHPVSKFLQVIKWKKGTSYLKIWDFWSYQRFLDHLSCTALWDLFTDIFFSTLAFSNRCSYVCSFFLFPVKCFQLAKKKKKKNQLLQPKMFFLTGIVTTTHQACLDVLDFCVAAAGAFLLLTLPLKVIFVQV